MADRWGLFLCDCRRTLALDPERLILPIAPSVLSFASDPESEIPAFARRVQEEQPDQVLIGCCASPRLFNEALNPHGSQAQKVHFVNLRESCFQVHSDDQEAHAKAYRLLRAAMETVETGAKREYNPLTVGGQILIAAELPQGRRLAEQIQDIAQPTLIVGAEHPPSDVSSNDKVLAGRILEVKGRLGSFQITIDDIGPAKSHRRELKADQVVVVSRDGLPDIRPRTGCHLLVDPSEADLNRLAERIRDLTGDFLKPVHVGYHPEICAGGAANQEACGICISACPYDAIARNPENPLRMRVDHMACEGCGACISACPTTSLQFTEPSPRELYGRLAGLLAPLPGQGNGGDCVVVFHCGEHGRRALEEAGRRPLAYSASILPVEVPCLRYVSEANMLAAFRLGAKGVGLLGCETCQHGERELLFQKMDFCHLTLDAFGLGAERLRLMTVSDGTEEESVATLSRFAETLSATPIHWDGRHLRHWSSREVIAETIEAFIEQTGKEPGRRMFDAPFPFAYADVKESGCTMCRSCVNVCPVHAFQLNENDSALQLRQLACVACGLCEKVCPENVITLRREVYFDRAALAYQTVVQDDMIACTKCGKPYINRKALEAVESRVLSLGSLLDTFTGDRRTLLRMCPDCRAVDAMSEVEKGWKP